jgi:hypothetical protein
VYEKEKRLRMMMKMHGLGDTAYWLVTYAWYLILYCLYIIVFIIFGSAIRLKIFTMTNYGAAVPALLSFCFLCIMLLDAGGLSRSGYIASCASSSVGNEAWWLATKRLHSPMLSVYVCVLCRLAEGWFILLCAAGIQIIFYFLFGNCMIAMAFMLSSLFTSSRTAVTVAFLYVFASGLIGELLLNVSSWHALKCAVMHNTAATFGQSHVSVCSCETRLQLLGVGT